MVGDVTGIKSFVTTIFKICNQHCQKPEFGHKSSTVVISVQETINNSTTHDGNLEVTLTSTRLTNILPTNRYTRHIVVTQKKLILGQKSWGRIEQATYLLNISEWFLIRELKSNSCIAHALQRTTKKHLKRIAVNIAIL